MTTNKNPYTVTAPTSPGAQPVEQPACSLIIARRMASLYRHRRDLSYQDVAIRMSGNGRLVEYAGPAR